MSVKRLLRLLLLLVTVTVFSLPAVSQQDFPSLSANNTFTGTNSIPICSYPVSLLPTNLSPRTVCIATDANPVCTVGGGTTTPAWCQWNGTSWVTISGGGSSGSGTVGYGSGYSLPSYSSSSTNSVGPSNITADSTGNNLNVPGAIVAGTTVSGSPTTTIAAGGADIGAQINAVLANSSNCPADSSGYQHCTIVLPYAQMATWGTSVTVTSPYVSIVGMGGPQSIFTCTVNGDCLRIYTNPFTIQQAGNFGGFTLSAPSTALANGVGMHVGEIVGAHFDDIEINGFTGTNGAALWLDNEYSGWTERNLFTKVHLNGGTKLLRFTVESGTQSFGYNRMLDVRLNPTVPGTTYGVSIENNALVYNGTYRFTLNNTGTGATLFHLQNTAQWTNDEFHIYGEDNGAAAYVWDICSTCSVSYWGEVQIANYGTGTDPSNIVGTYQRQGYVDPSAASTIVLNSLLAPNAPNSGYVQDYFGVANSTNNALVTTFNYVSTGNPGNTVGFQLYGDPQVLQITPTGITTAPITETGTQASTFTNTASATYPNTGEYLAPNLTQGADFYVGQALTAYDADDIRFNYAGSGSSANYLGLGLYNHSDLLNIFGTGDVSIGTTSDCGPLCVVGSNPVEITNTASATYPNVGQFLAPNLTSGADIFAGQALTTNDAIDLKFNYAGSGSTSNCAGVGLYNNANLLEVCGNGMTTVEGLTDTACTTKGIATTTSGGVIGCSAANGPSSGAPVISTNGLGCLDSYDHTPCVVAELTQQSYSGTTGTNSNNYAALLSSAPVGIYRACYFIMTTVAGSAGSFQGFIQFTANGQTKGNPVTNNVNVTPQYSYSSGAASCGVVYSDASANINYLITGTSVTGSPTIVYDLTLERLY